MIILGFAGVGFMAYLGKPDWMHIRIA